MTQLLYIYRHSCFLYAAYNNVIFVIGGRKIISKQNTEEGFCYHLCSACRISAPVEFGCHPVGGCGKARGLDALARTSYAAAEITKNRHPRVQIRRWVGKYDKQLLENIFGVLGCGIGAKCRRPCALVWSEWFTPTSVVGSRFSSGETWPGRFILPEAVRNVPKADHFSAFWSVRLPSSPPQPCLISGVLRVKAWAPAFDALLSFSLIACESDEAQLGWAESTLVTARWHALMAQLEAQSAYQHWTSAMLYLARWNNLKHWSALISVSRSRLRSVDSSDLLMYYCNHRLL